MTKLIYGFHSVNSFIETSPHDVEVLYVSLKRSDQRILDLTAKATANSITVSHLSAEELNNLVPKNHQGVIAKVNLPQKHSLENLLALLDSKEKSIILILDGITDPHNLGSIIRSADFFGVDGIILPKHNSVSCESDAVIKVASGAINNIPVVHVNNLNQAIDKLKSHRFWIAGTLLAPDAIDLFTFKPTPKIAWVMGSEGFGMRRLVSENCDYKVTILPHGKTGSLNVTIATGIVLAHTRNFMEKN